MQKYDAPKEKVRLFFGSFIESEKVEYDKYQKSFIDYYGRFIKPVKAKNIHLTWKFLGDTDLDMVENIIEKADSLNISEFKALIKFQKFEIWPSLKRPRQIVLHGSHVDEFASSFCNNLNSALKDLSIKEDKKHFNPHITFARFKHIEDFDKTIRLPYDGFFDEVICEIKNFQLIKSILTPAGSLYEVLKTF